MSALAKFFFSEKNFWKKMPITSEDKQILMDNCKLDTFNPN